LERRIHAAAENSVLRPFLQLAAAESGQMLNYSNNSQEAGISQPTVKGHHQQLP